jgi:hypothetical protein
VVLCTINVEPIQAAPELSNQGFDLSAPEVTVDRTNRPLMCWDSIEIDRPFAVRHWAPTAAENLGYANEIDDNNPMFDGTDVPLVHPHLLLSQANTVLVDEFEMPAWIHVGSEIQLHQPLIAGRSYRIFAKPVKKWRRKNHEFVTVYIAYAADKVAITEIYHTAIYNVGANEVGAN